MKKLRGSLWAKALAVMLLCLLALGCVASALAAGWLYEEGAYTEGHDGAARSVLQQPAQQHAESAGLNWIENGKTGLYEDGNFRYTLTDAEGKELFSNYGSEAVLWSETIPVAAPFDSWTGLTAAPEVTPTPAPEDVRVTPVPLPDCPMEITVVFDRLNGERLEFTDRADYEAWVQARTVQVRGFVLRDMKAQDVFAQRLALLDEVYGLRAVLPWLAGAALLLGVLLFVFLMSAAGHRDETDAVTPGFVERIPWDLFTAILGLGIIALLFAIGEAFAFEVPALLLCGGAFLLAGLLFLLWCMSTAVRLKLGTLLDSCLLWKLLRWCGKLVRAIFRALGKLPLIWKAAVGVAALALVDLIWRMGSLRDEGLASTGWLLLWLLVGFAVCYAALAFRRLRLGAKRIAAGDESATVDTKRLVWDFKDHAEDLNNIRAGLSRAVDERMKSERLKTELITNVSHDIKTPLTSIVSYVDLLGREELESEKARDYVEVLRRQAARLKKLIDDLTEASKASTGNLPVELTRCELGVLLEQTAGEYAERLEQAGLTLVLDKPAEPVAVMADGRHLWRILDNLMSNVCKYALSGTRVYLSLAREGERAVVTLRNISRERLGVDGQELTERFVRGDSARSTEGSGLGLAIAQSLAQLQGAELAVTVDGDLFKVTLRFAAA